MSTMNNSVPWVVDRRIPGAVENYKKYAALGPQWSAELEAKKKASASAEKTAEAVAKKPAAPVAPKDTAQISDTAQADGPKTLPVKVEAWGKGKNDSLESILTGQGYSLEEIYGKDKDGKRLLDQVASSNNLKNPDLIYSGQELKIPAKPPVEEKTDASADKTAVDKTAATVDKPAVKPSGTGTSDVARDLRDGSTAIAALEKNEDLRKGNAFSDKGLNMTADLKGKLGMLDKLKDENGWDSLVDSSSPGRAGVQMRSQQRRNADSFKVLYDNAPGKTHDEKVQWVKNLVNSADQFDRQQPTMKSVVEQLNRSADGSDALNDVYRSSDFSAYLVSQGQDQAA